MAAIEADRQIYLPMYPLSSNVINGSSISHEICNWSVSSSQCDSPYNKKKSSHNNIVYRYSVCHQFGDCRDLEIVKRVCIVWVENNSIHVYHDLYIWTKCYFAYCYSDVIQIVVMYKSCVYILTYYIHMWIATLIFTGRSRQTTSAIPEIVLIGVIQGLCSFVFTFYSSIDIPLQWRHIVTAMASQITSLTIVYSIVYSGVDQRKHQSSASPAFVWGIHRWPVNSPHKWPVTRKIFPFDDIIMILMYYIHIWIATMMFTGRLRQRFRNSINWCDTRFM